MLPIILREQKNIFITYKTFTLLLWDNLFLLKIWWKWVESGLKGDEPFNSLLLITKIISKIGYDAIKKINGNNSEVELFEKLIKETDAKKNPKK